MTRSEILLAGLAAGGENTTYTPVQVQKLFFLLDREAAAALGGPFKAPAAIACTVCLRLGRSRGVACSIPCNRQ
jgi:hypothetical protein